MLEFRVNLNTLNKPETPNRSMHHMEKHSRNKKLNKAITIAFLEKGTRIKAQRLLGLCDPDYVDDNGLQAKKTLLVTICYVHPWKFDKDNLIASMKHVIDTLADNLIPNLAAGRADNDPRLRFECIQRSGIPREYALEIKLQQIKERKPECVGIV